MQLRQENMTVEEYTSNFYHFATHCDLELNEDIMIAVFREGLKPQVSTRLAAVMLYSLNDAIQVATQIEEDFLTRS